MRISVTVGFCAVVCILGWLNLSACGYFLLSVLVHETGHLAALTLCGVSVRRLRLTACGAMIETAIMSNPQELLCAAVGPMSSFLLGIGLFRLAPQASLISFGITAVNLLPLYPLDGGRMLHAVLMMCCSQERAERILYMVSIAVCIFLMLLACWITVSLQAGIWPIFAALVLLCRIGSSEKQLLFCAAADKMKEPD